MVLQGRVIKQSSRGDKADARGGLFIPGVGDKGLDFGLEGIGARSESLVVVN